jgi:hypothetical protein
MLTLTPQSLLTDAEPVKHCGTMLVTAHPTAAPHNSRVGFSSRWPVQATSLSGHADETKQFI